MNPFLLTPNERLADWKTLREEIKQLDEDEALLRVAKYWAQAPIVRMAYDFEECVDWPSPWEMVHAGNWCPYSIAIGMEFTLRLAGWNPNRFELQAIRDYDISEQLMILKIDDTFVLNYTTGMIESVLTTRHDVLAAFKNDGKRYFKITK